MNKASMGIIQHLLLDGKIESALRLMQYWEVYRQISGTTTELMDQEMKLFLKKINKLQEILKIMATHVDPVQIKKLADRLDSIATAINTENSLNAGGKFEWVDSILIKCLQNGSWLLVDNVNLCSSAVLDRLNALLEPNGVLTISERGVDSNGQMIEIKPHKDFRLFLTMDPKNGEISRAMRNRGIEIYLLNENELATYNNFDRISLVNLEGLHTPYADIAIQLHNFISEIIISEKPNINELIQVSKLLSQQLKYEVNQTEAFINTVLEVYYKTRSKYEFNCQDFPVLIRDKIEYFLNMNKDVNSEYFNKNLTLKTDGISTQASIEKIKQQSILLFNLLQKEENINLEICYLLLNFYSITSSEDLCIRHLFIKKKINTIPISQQYKDTLLMVINYIYELVKTKNLSTNLPLDKNWISEENINDSNSNQLNLLLYSSIHQFLANLELVSKSEGTVSIENNELLYKNMTKKLSLIKYAILIDEKKIDDKFNNIIIQNYTKLQREVNVYINKIFNNLNNITDDNVIDIIYLLFWRIKLFENFFCDVKKNPNDLKMVLNNLSVHYKWFYKYSIKQISTITNLPLHNNLLTILSNINSKLDKQFSIMYKLGKNYQKSNKSPPPFTTQQQLLIIKNFNENYKLYDLLHPGNDTIKIINIFYGNPELRSTLIQFKSELEYDFINIDKKQEYINNIQQYIKKDNIVSYSKYDLQLLPIIDIFTNLELKKYMTSEDCSTTFVNNILIPAELSGALVAYQRTKDNRLLHEIYKSFYLYLLSSPSVRPTKFLGLDESIELNLFSPKLTYLVSNLMMDSKKIDNLGQITLGNFRDLSVQHETLNLILWRNLYQLFDEKYSFVYMEKQNIDKIYKKFLLELAHSLKLHINSNESLQEVSIKITSCLEQIQSSSTSVDPNKELYILITKLKQCSEKYTTFNNLTEIDEVILEISYFYQTISYLKAKLNSKLSTIDPLAKKTIKRRYCIEVKDMLKIMKTCYENLNKIYSNTETTVHSYCIPIEKILIMLEDKHKELSKYVAYRPDDVLYETVCEVVNHAFSTILSEDFVSKIDGTSDKNIEERVNKVISYENLVHELSQFKNSYPDIIEPLLSNVAEFLYGFKLNTAALKMMNKKLTDTNHLGVNPLKLLKSLISFPVLTATQKDYSSYVKLLTSNDVKNCVNYYLEDSDEPYVKDQELFRLLKIAIQESFNNAVINYESNETLNKNDFYEFSELIDVFVSGYNKQQEQNEMKEIESESIYKVKSKCDEKSEEEQIKEDLKKLFPNYHTTDFADFEQTLDNSDIISDTDTEIKLEDVITYNDLIEIVNLHSVLITNFTKTEWINPPKNKVSVDFIQPLIEKYKLFTKILNKTINSLDYKMDETTISSLNILVAVKKQYGDTSGLTTQVSTQKKNGDFYKDSNTEEVKSCYHILEELKIKINELLLEWPDQPTLKTIITIIDRIYTFHITSPISRFLTGFEILLSKCHEWEEVAHSGVSLSSYYHNITNQIITWRKLELSMWKDLLNRVNERLNETLPKWWLHLYNIMHQFIIQKQFDEKQLIDTIQSFITKSNLAEFQGRLNLIYIFHCHATFLHQTKETQSFINILWNIYSYFQQFTDVVNKQIKKLRTPIEKKLKDYVKIVRWKDINYWAIKETVDKSHKTLHKFMREYQDALEQPVSSCLGNVSNDNVDENIGIWDKTQREEKDQAYYLPELFYNQYLVDFETLKQQLPEEKLLSEMKSKTKLFTQIKRAGIDAKEIFKNVLQKAHYRNVTKALYEFLNDVITTSNHLQKLEVDTTLPKEKQKSQAKNILQQKHRALADLFKTLTKMGLSYKTGIVEHKIKDPVSDFLLKPIDLHASFSHLNNRLEDNTIKKFWESAEKYYNRSVMRTDVLETALQNPNKELGKQNTERCKGFNFHLLTVIQQQKSLLTESSRIYYYLRYYCQQLKQFSTGVDYLSVSTIDAIINLLTKVINVVDQYQIILNTCPDEGNFNVGNLNIPVLKSDTENRISYKNDETWNKGFAILNKIKTLSLKIVKEFVKSKAQIPFTEYELGQEKYIATKKRDTYIKDLNEIKSYLVTFEDLCGNIALTDNLIWLQNEIEAKIGSISYVKSVSQNTELLCDKEIQTFLKLTKSITKKLSKEYEHVESDLEETDIKDEHIKKYLLEHLSRDSDILEMKNILSSTEKITNFVLDSNSTNVEKRKMFVKEFLPCFEQMILGYSWYISEQVAAYRASTKICSILLNIFIELASKGFCIPPEFSDEFDKEGISKPSDGMGLGDGEGERDASDKIESEDQLDDAQPAGQEKENDDKDCKEEEKGIEMSEDFDSKLQDKEKKTDDSDDENSGDSDAEEQMGETEKGAEQSNKETFGDEEEEGEGEQEEGSEQKEEKGDQGEKEGDDQLAAKEDQTSKEEDDKQVSKEKEQTKKDINEMDEPEYDDEQIDPHHGKQPELPEPEPMDLPDDMQLDEGEPMDDNEDQNKEENPFDIDTIKEDNIPDNKENDAQDDNKDESNKDEEKEFSSDDEDIEKGENKDGEENIGDEDNDDNTDKDKNKDSTNKEENIDDNSSENGDETGLDQTQSHQENIEAMEVDDADAADKAQASKAENQQSNQPIDELHQEDRPDQEGVGQSQMEQSSSGHAAQTSAPQEIKTSQDNNKEELKRKQKPGESDSKRSLGDINQPLKKRLKTMDSKNEERKESNSNEDREESAEMYQHIKEAEEMSYQQVLDVATKEQAENQRKETKHQENQDDDDENMESSKDLPSEEETELKEADDIPKLNPEKNNESSTDKKNKKSQHPQGDILEELKDVEIEGDVIETHTVSRSTDSTHHTQLSTVLESTATRLSVDEINNLRVDVEKQLSSWNEPPSTLEADQAWQKISSVTSSLAQDLSEQLRLVLEPTQASRLKGDFRTGRRINMRKVIPYIASQFRKDKIWLRRTKPSKREYQIVLAIDNSSSMADNHSKELAFESVALISKALTLLETGQLSVLSFGERIEVVHKLHDTFTDKSGIKLLQKFKFDENKTCIAKLVDFATEMFNQSQLSTTALNAKLLIIVSDGRGVFSEGETFVRQAVRRAKLSNIFMVFVIVDNPVNKNSVLDIRMPVFRDGKLQEIQTYMDVFPFSFYIILRDINSLPSVLSDALRQWFEIVSNLDK